MTSQSSRRFSCRRRRSRCLQAAASAPVAKGSSAFALVENEQRITQAVRGLRKALTKLG